MKRAISIFLMNIMMIIAVHPVIAMHFCDGELYSYDLYKTSDDHSCCIVPHANNILDEDGACCDEVNSKTEFTQEGCCDFDTVEISTDDFQHQSNVINFLLSLLNPIDNNWFTINDLFALNQPETNTTAPYNEFSTKGLFMEDVSILTYICIYRI